MDVHEASYFSLTVGQIDTVDVPERIRRGMGQHPMSMHSIAVSDSNRRQTTNGNSSCYSAWLPY